ncbi:MAG TPA: enoyl-ACP reductase FabI [Gallionellaceae bacterium]|nr:enoyl-ACP reductase FabI [Gallionellaceae bacterium]
MGFLANKRILVTGMISNRSIAYGIAQAMHREGAELAFTYQGDRVRKRVEEMSKEFGSELVFLCDVSNDGDIDQLFANLGKHWGKFDGFVHAIAFAPREALNGEFLDGFSREAFRIAHDVSAYSFPAMAKVALPYLNNDASLLTLSYLGAVRTMPHYNVMGLAKASLEASVRYLAMDLGRRGSIRVNGISAGPIRTLAAAGIADFSKLLAYNEKNAPLKRNVTIEEVGNAAAFLCSDLASGITGEITYVDGGFNTTALGTTEA